VTEQRLIHFLLVEDDDAHAEITIRSLKQNRVANKVDRVVDGAEALAYLRDPDRPLPDVILLCAIPIVVLTTSDAEVDRLKAYRHHANSYLVKPIDFNRFRQMVVELSLYWGVWNQPPSDVHSVNRNGERR
jgi:CheY-like chemotaxis protein